MTDQRYQVLARKWRPQTFSEVVGQSHVTRSLANAVTNERVHHAYLLCGPRGVGKTTIARILSKALNCAEGPTAEPCLECASCRGVAQGSSMDVLEIDGASNNSVEQVRDLRETLGYAPAESRFRIVIIDEVHMLSRAAFNALLKTLEEPPPHVVFIFATTDANKVIPTVQSRCQRYDFHRLSVADIRTQLAHVAEAEGVLVEPGGLDLIAQRADGALRDAESLLDQVSAATDGPVDAARVADLIGAVERGVYLELMRAVADHDAAAALGVVAEATSRGRSSSEFVGGLMLHLRHLLACRVGAESALIELEQEDKALLAEQAGSFAERDLLRMLNAVADAESSLSTSAAPQVRVELAILKMAYMENTVELSDLMAQLEKIASDTPASAPPAKARAPAPESTPGPAAETTSDPEDSLEQPLAPEPVDPGPEPPAEAEPAAIEKPAPRAHPEERTSIAVLSARWPEIATELKDKGLPAWIDSQVRPASFEDGVLSLVLKDQFHADRLRKSQDTVLPVIRARFPDVLTLDVRIEDASAREAKSRSGGQQQSALLDAIVDEEPIVGKLIEGLGLRLERSQSP